MQTVDTPRILIEARRLFLSEVTVTIDYNLSDAEKELQKLKELTCNVISHQPALTED